MIIRTPDGYVFTWRAGQLAVRVDRGPFRLPDVPAPAGTSAEALLAVVDRYPRESTIRFTP